MSTKYVYPIVLLIVMFAWFGQSTTKPSIASKAQDENRQKVVSQFIKDPILLELKPDEWIEGGDCNLEFINDAPMSTNVHTIAKDSELKLVGWAMDVGKKRLPTQIVTRFTNDNNTDIYALNQIGFVRPDVREYFDLPDKVSASGFELVVNLGDVSAGQYALTLIVKLDGISYLCDNGRKINVR